MQFVISYSGGKDSVLALHKMVEQGHTPVALLVMYREEDGRSWTHGLKVELLNAVSDALGIPLLRCSAGSETYDADMEQALQLAASLGAEAGVFGDIDIIRHREWDEARCAAAGLRAILPLWQRNREENAHEAVSLGYRCLIKSVRNGVLPESLLGRPLSKKLFSELKAYGVDLCGENGEYHTVVVDGPLFKRPVPVKSRGVARLEHITAIDLVVNGMETR